MSLPGLDLGALRTYMLEEGMHLDGELRATPFSHGRSNLTYLVGDDASKWVFRRPPTAGLTPSAHAVDREFRVTAALAGSPVPVPEAISLCMDVEVLGSLFTLSGFVDGRTLNTQDDLLVFSDVELKAVSNELMSTLADLHALDPGSIGLGDFGRPGYVERQTNLWFRQWGLVKGGSSADADSVHSRLIGRLPVERPLALVHGDYRIDNVMVSPDRVDQIVAVVDWELSTLGDPGCDLAMTCAYRHPAFDLIRGESAASTSPRMASAEAMVEAYLARSDLDLGDWDFYLAFAYFKIAVIAQGIHHRFEVGAASGPGYDTAGESVPELLAAASMLLARN